MNIWTKFFILALNNLKYGKLKLSIEEDHYLISGKLSGPNADLKIENKDIITKYLKEGNMEELALPSKKEDTIDKYLCS